MSRLATLEIRIKSLEAEVADKRLQGLATSGTKAERATDGLTASMKRFAGPVALAAGSVASLTKLVGVTRQFDVLNAQLTTATGSSENATKAFEAIQEFATTTPYDLAQATEGFTKLVNLGLTPSERAMVSYGDTASAMGKNLNQMIEAVADASTGEFERLKEFGIRSKRQGDQVSFTFRGITETVGFESAQIEEYLIGLGENNFAGAMVNRMNTLDGALSNLGDEWNKLWLNISAQGIGGQIEETVRLGIDALDELNRMISSGELAGFASAIGLSFVGLLDDFQATVEIMSLMWNEVFGVNSKGGIGAAATATVDFLIEAFARMPQNIRATVQLIVIEIATMVDKTLAHIDAFKEGLLFPQDIPALELEVKVETEKLTEAQDKLEELRGEFGLFAQQTRRGLTAEIALRERNIAGLEDELAVGSNLQDRLAQINEVRDSSVSSILTERAVAIESVDAQIIATKKLREEYEKNREEKAKDKGDVLSLFKTGGKDGKDAGDRETDAQRKVREAREKEFANLVEDLRSEEEVIITSYNRRLAMILSNTEEGSLQQNELKKKLDAQFAEDALGELSAPTSYDQELEAIEIFYEARRELILSNLELEHEERTRLEEELTLSRNERLASLESARNEILLATSASMFGDLANIAAAFGGKQNAIYKGLFAASKAFAIAESIVKIQQGIASAAAQPWPLNLAAIASTVAATASIVTTIQSVQYAGAFDKGGFIPSGQFGIVGEYGAEIVQGPANVTSRRETAELFREAQSNPPAPTKNGGNTVIHFNVTSENADSFKRSRGEIEAGLMNTISRARRRG